LQPSDTLQIQDLLEKLLYRIHMYVTEDLPQGALKRL